MKVRHIKNRDWDEIVALERQTYLSVLSENRTALTSKNSASPFTCFVLEVEGYQWLSLMAVSGFRFFWKAQEYDSCPEIVLPKSYGRAVIQHEDNKEG